MDSTHPENEGGDAFLMPYSRFVPWRKQYDNISPANRNGNDGNNASNWGITSADTARYDSMESQPTPSVLVSGGNYDDDDDASSMMRRRGSSVFYSPVSYDDAVSPVTIEAPAQQDDTTTTAAPPSPSPVSSKFPPPPPQVAAMSHSRSFGSSRAGAVSRFSSLASSSLPPLTEQDSNIPEVTEVSARRSAAIMAPYPGADSIPMSAIYGPEPSPSIMTSDDGGDAGDGFTRRYGGKPPISSNCYSRQDVYIKRWSSLYVTLLVLAVYSTALSALWLIVSIVQPRYGRGVSTGSRVQLTPSTATLLAALVAKTIELSFVTVFVAVLGQVLTRRAFSRHSRGITLAEMTMRNWVIQPGSLLTYWGGVGKAATTLLGALTLSATICALFYTTASDAMVSPKLKRQGWVERDLKGLVKTPYGNPSYAGDTCPTPLRDLDPVQAHISCLDIIFSGQSYHSLITFMSEWDEIHNTHNTTNRSMLSERPTGKHTLYDNTTLESSWIETEHVWGLAKHNNRVVNNVTLAMPHPGIYAAATDATNGILQPNELLGLGEYSIRASVVSPVINVLCANVDADEIAPLVYTRWPWARTETTEIPGQSRAADGWEADIPANWGNSTVVDDLFRWGDGFDRKPPAFPLYPFESNIVTYAPGAYNESFYLLAKGARLDSYTLCELRSWVTTKCSTAFDMSGTLGGHMKAYCSDADADTYKRVYNGGWEGEDTPSRDWRNLVKEWGVSINLGGGIQNNNASNSLVLTSLISDEAVLDPLLPSMAEALAVLASSTLVVSSLDSTFAPMWTHADVANPEDMIVKAGVYESFHARVRTQQYASAHTASWQAVLFYPILGLTFLLNVFCLFYLLFGTALTTSLSSSGGSSRRKRTTTNHHRPQSSISSLLTKLPFIDRPTTTAPRTTYPIHNHDHVIITGPESDDDDGNELPEPTTGNKAAKGLVTDYTEPQNLFALAINSPPGLAIAGSCGPGPDAQEMSIPWRVQYASNTNHYYFEADESGGTTGQGIKAATSSGADLLGNRSGHDNGRYGQSYKRISSMRTWL